MNKVSKLKDRLIEIFSSAELPRPFAMTDTLPNYAFEYYENFFDNLFKENKFEEPYEYTEGATKFIIIFPKQEIVIKIPYEGKFRPNYGYYEDELIFDEMVFKGKSHYFNFVPYRNADQLLYDNSIFINNRWDYCLTEVIFYNRIIKKSGYSNFFMKTNNLCSTKDNFPIYFQKQIITLNSDDAHSIESSISEKSLNYLREEINCIKGCFFVLPFHFLYFVSEMASLKKALDLDGFIRKTEIHDLWRGNLGYRKNGAPVILDYACFYH